MAISTYEELCSDVVGQMFRYMTVDQGFKIKPLPENDDQVKLPFKSLSVECAFKYSEFGKPLAMGMNAQEESIDLELIIQSRSIRGPEGIYKGIWLINKALADYQPNNFRRMTAHKIFYDGFVKGVHQYSYIWQTKGMLVPFNASEDYYLPEESDLLLKKITIEENSITVITVTEEGG